MTLYHTHNWPTGKESLKIQAKNTQMTLYQTHDWPTGKGSLKIPTKNTHCMFTATQQQQYTTIGFSSGLILRFLSLNRRDKIIIKQNLRYAC